MRNTDMEGKSGETSNGGSGFEGDAGRNQVKTRIEELI